MAAVLMAGSHGTARRYLVMAGARCHPDGFECRPYRVMVGVRPGQAASRQWISRDSSKQSSSAPPRSHKAAPQLSWLSVVKSFHAWVHQQSGLGCRGRPCNNYCAGAPVPVRIPLAAFKRLQFAIEFNATEALRADRRLGTDNTARLP